MTSSRFAPLNYYSRKIAAQAASALNGKSVMITGGGGLLGLTCLSYLEFLRKEFDSNVEVFLTSRSSSSLSFGYEFGNSFHPIAADLSSPKGISALPICDFVIHGAGYAQPNLFLKDPTNTIALNVTATMELYRKALQGFLFISSSEVYSGIESVTINESEIGTTNTTHPRASYIESKRTGEVVALMESPSNGVKGNVARVSLAYGPGPKFSDGRVMNELIRRGIQDGIVTLRDTGNRVRTYCYAEDIIELLFSILIAEKKEGGDIYNVAGNSRITIRELARMISMHLEVPLEIPDSNEFEDSSPNQVGLDISKVLSLSGKKDFVQLDIGLAKTIEWMQRISSRP